jgi:hypothetical protein
MRMNALEEEQLCSIEGSKSSEVSLVQQGLTNGAVRLSGEPPDRLLRIPIRSQEVRPKMPDNGVFRGCRNEFDDR